MDESGEPQRADVKAEVTRRRHVWRATYRDGLVLEEQPDARVGPRFEDLEADRLARFGLVDRATGTEVLGFCARTGLFHARGRRLEFFLGDLSLTNRPEARYGCARQFKSAHVEHRAADGSSGTVVDAHHLGYGVDLPEVRFEVMLRLDVTTGRLGIRARLMPPRGATLPAGPFFVLVDGARVDTQAEFDDALKQARRDRPSGAEV